MNAELGVFVPTSAPKRMSIICGYPARLTVTKIRSSVELLVLFFGRIFSAPNPCLRYFQAAPLNLSAPLSSQAGGNRSRTRGYFSGGLHDAPCALSIQIGNDPLTTKVPDRYDPGRIRECRRLTNTASNTMDRVCPQAKTRRNTCYCKWGRRPRSRCRALKAAAVVPAPYNVATGNIASQ
jgi:hypothetical protein